MCLISSSISLLTFNNFISKFPTLFFGFQKLCFPFYIIFSIHLLAIPHGMWDLSFPASVRTCAPEVEAQSLNTGLTKNSSVSFSLDVFFPVSFLSELLFFLSSLLLLSSLSALIWSCIQDQSSEVSCLDVVPHWKRKEENDYFHNFQVLLFKNLKYSRTLKTHEGPQINKPKRKKVYTHDRLGFCRKCLIQFFLVTQVSLFL